MSPSPIRLTIVTDSVERASLALFGFSLRSAGLEAPWCRFVDKTHLFPTIPDGAAVMALWFDTDPLMEIRWFNERQRRPFDFDWGKHAERIADWLARRQALELDLIERARLAEPVRAAVDAASPPARPLPSNTQAELRTMWS